MINIRIINSNIKIKILIINRNMILNKSYIYFFLILKIVTGISPWPVFNFVNPSGRFLEHRTHINK